MPREQFNPDTSTSLHDLDVGSDVLVWVSVRPQVSADCTLLYLLCSPWQEKTLTIVSFNYDQFCGHECTGTLSLELSELDFEMSDSIELWRPFKPFKEPDGQEVMRLYIFV